MNFTEDDEWQYDDGYPPVGLRLVDLVDGPEPALPGAMRLLAREDAER